MPQLNHPVRAVVAFAIAVGVGILLRALTVRLARRATRTRSERDDVILTVISHLVLPVSVLIGARVALTFLALTSQQRGIAHRSIVALSIMVVTIVVARDLSTLVIKMAPRRYGITQSATIFANIARVIIVVIGLLIALASLDISIAPLLTAFGVGGIAVALALQDTLSNLFAGVHLLASRKVRAGDFVRLDSGEEGYITDINWRNTSIRQLPNNHVIVPNAHLASTIITNYYRPVRALSLVMEVSTAYGSDLDHVERVTIEVASQVQREVDGAVREHQPFVRFHTFGDWSIDYSVILQVDEFTDQYLVKHEFIKRLLARYRVEGIEIPFPIKTVIGRAQTSANGDR